MHFLAYLSISIEDRIFSTNPQNLLTECLVLLWVLLVYEGRHGEGQELSDGCLASLNLLLHGLTESRPHHVLHQGLHHILLAEPCVHIVQTYSALFTSDCSQARSRAYLLAPRGRLKGIAP